jgi:hypothetical protein
MLSEEQFASLWEEIKTKRDRENFTSKVEKFISFREGINLL